MFNTPWNEKTVKQKAAAIGFLLGIFIGALVIAYAVSCYVAHNTFVITIH